jgi:hypothetical protein
MAITAILLNWNRAFNLKQIILPLLSRHPLINEIIISHGKSSSMFDYESPYCQIVHRDDVFNNQTYGLSCRFLAMMEAKNDQVLILDDDLLVFSKSISRLSQYYLTDPMIIHGLFGRSVNNNYQYCYTDWLYGYVPIVLTKCMILNKCYGELFLERADMMKDILNKGDPYWNGEDIFMSLVTTHKTNKLPCAYRLPYLNLIYSELNGISSSWRGFFVKKKPGTLSHGEYRKLFTQTCIERLELQSIMNKWLGNS